MGRSLLNGFKDSPTMARITLLLSLLFLCFCLVQGTNKDESQLANEHHERSDLARNVRSPNAAKQTNRKKPSKRTNKKSSKGKSRGKNKKRKSASKLEKTKKSKKQGKGAKRQSKKRSKGR